MNYDLRICKTVGESGDCIIQPTEYEKVTAGLFGVVCVCVYCFCVLSDIKGFKRNVENGF